MKAQDFLAWMDATGNANAVAVHKSLHIARETARVMVEAARDGRDVSVKPTVALAMTALAQGLKPWDEYER